MVMLRWAVVFGLVLMAARAWAVDCTDPNSVGFNCVLSDGITQGACVGGACIRTYTIPGNAARTGTGTISSSGGTVTGSGTAFTTELYVGDVLTVNSQRVAISAIAAADSLTTQPALFPPVSAAAFTYTNPIVRWIDESGNTIAILDSRGLVAFGQAYANIAMSVIGPAETGAQVVGKGVFIKSGAGGPSSASAIGGTGGGTTITGGPGGTSSVTLRSPGVGGASVFRGGTGGEDLVTGEQGGTGGLGQLAGGIGGTGAAGGGAGGPGGKAIVLGGQGGAGTPQGVGGDVAIEVGVGTGTPAINICDTGGIVKVGTTGQTQVACATGDITQIKNVPVAGMWNVNAFQQANAGGM